MFDFRVSKALSSRCFSLEPGFSPRYSLENSSDPLTSAEGRDKPVERGVSSAIMDGGVLKVNLAGQAWWAGSCQSPPLHSQARVSTMTLIG